jgi:hypothetical protein
VKNLDILILSEMDITDITISISNIETIKRKNENRRNSFSLFELFIAVKQYVAFSRTAIGLE